MSLTRYWQKRNFTRTPEPRGKGRASPSRAFTPPARLATSRSKDGARSKPLRFVIQLHDARRLHYDFRLEMEGVLKSWAVPKGLPTQKADRRLAMEVEDHPLEYGRFEGTIPEGNYGAGTVMLWDHGTYEVYGDPLESLHQGKIHFVLHGKKVSGEWTLVRMKPRDPSDKIAWLLIKSNTDFTGDLPERSVVSGKSMEQIANNRRGKVWESNRERPAAAMAKPRSKRQIERPAPKVSAQSLPAGILEIIKKCPHENSAYITPMNARLVAQAPADEGWVYEIKWDGYRAIALKHNQQVKLFSRRSNDVTADFAVLASAIETLPGKTFVLDGEIVALDESGHASFQRLQNFRHHSTGGADLFYYLFDILNLENHDLKALPLEQRKNILKSLLQNARDPLRYSASLTGQGSDLLAQANKNRVEGLIAKRRDSVYEPGRRSGAWLKIKIALEQEFVIGGYTEPKGTRPHFGALLLGYYEHGKLLFASKTGTGFTQESLKLLYDEMQPYKTERCPFANLPSRHPGSDGLSPAEMRRCTWLKPALVCQVRFTEWTDHGGLRHPVFLGLRDDKDPSEVIRERPLR